MSLTETGYIPETLDVIMSRLSSNLKESFPTININPDNLVYQFLKGVSLEILSTQGQHGMIMDNQSMIGASGYQLDVLLREYGLDRKIPTNSDGNVICYGTPDSSIIPAATTFTSVSNIDYESTEIRIYSGYFPIKRVSGYYDRIPSPYINLAAVSGLFSDPDYNTSITESAWSYSDDIITWSNTELINVGATYYCQPSGVMALKVPVQCKIVGSDGNTAANTITTNTDNISSISSLTNEIALTSGRNMESDTDGRSRGQEASGKSFTMADIKSKVSNLYSVRDAKVVQNLGTDRSIFSDWSDVDLDCTGAADLIYLTGTDYYGFSYYPDRDVSTLGDIVMWAKTTGSAPDLNVYFKLHSSGLNNTDNTSYLDKKTISRGTLKRDEEDVFQDVHLGCNYNGVDTTLTYKVYLQSSSAADINNCFIIASTGWYTAASNSYRLDSFISGATIEPKQMIYKTKYKSPGYTVSIIPEDGYVFETDISPEIEDLLDDVDGGGYSTIGIPKNINEASKVYLSVLGKLYIEDNSNFTDIHGNIVGEIAVYLRELNLGDNIVFSQVEKKILNVNGVVKVYNLRMKINDGTYVLRSEEKDISVEDNEYVVNDTDGLYDGIVLEEG